MGKANSMSSQHSKTTIVPKDSKSKVKSNNELDMETSWAEQLDAL